MSMFYPKVKTIKPLGVSYALLEAFLFGGVIP
jgi:hypothetical protein